MLASRGLAFGVTVLIAGVTLLAGCSGSTTQDAGVDANGTAGPAPPAVRSIAKDDGVPPPGVSPSYSTVLVVPDDLIPTVLADVGVEQLPRQDGEPLQTGRYADVEGSADLAAGEVLVLWYSGQSGSCPSYLRGLRVTADGDVDVETSTPVHRGCTDDYDPYRQLVSVPEDVVPALTALPLTLGGENPTQADDLVVAVYSPPSAP